jgi:hypothetical protein
MKQKINKVLNILVYCFVFVAAVFTFLTISMKSNNKDGVTIFGHQMMLVETGSMEKNDLVNVEDYEIKSIKQNSLIFVKVVDEDNPNEFYDDIEINDVLTFKYMIGNKQQTITHRVIDIKEKEDGFVFYLRGDNINADGTTSTQILDTTNEDSFNYVVGKVVGVSYFVGVLVTAVKSDIGLILYKNSKLSFILFLPNTCYLFIRNLVITLFYFKMECHTVIHNKGILIINSNSYCNNRSFNCIISCYCQVAIIRSR